MLMLIYSDFFVLTDKTKFCTKDMYKVTLSEKIQQDLRIPVARHSILLFCVIIMPLESKSKVYDLNFYD